MVRAGIVASGGAISPARGEHADALAKVVAEGMSRLAGGSAALDVVEWVARQIEDDSRFNCGTGARLNLVGDAELDAAIMDGATLRAGAVASIREVRNPVSVARKVMDETDHILLVGTGAEKFARAMGFEKFDPVTDFRRQEWADIRGKLKRGEELPPSQARVLKYFVKLRNWMDDDTVGVTAIDHDGHVAVATSSGGGPLKMPGRVGDVPSIGCGFYADNLGGAAALTGNGEVIMRFLVAKTASDLMAQGKSAQEAAEEVLRLVNRRAPGAVVAIVTLDGRGGLGGARNVDTTPLVMAYEGGDLQVDFAPVLKA